MKKTRLVCYSALLFLTIGCQKEDVTPTPQEEEGIPADVLAVLKKHKSSYSVVPTGKAISHSKSVFKNAQELDSLLTQFESAMRDTRLVRLAPEISSGKGNSANRLLPGIGTASFAVTVPSYMYQTAIDPYTRVGVDILYTYCTGDGDFRTASIRSRLDGPTNYGDSGLSYDSPTTSVNVFSNQVRYAFTAHFTYTLYSAIGSSQILTRNEWTQLYSDGISNGTSEFIIDDDPCDEERYPRPPAYNSSGTGSSGGSGGGSGSPTGSGPAPIQYPAPGYPSGGGGGGVPTSGGGSNDGSGSGGTIPKPPPPTQPEENV
jgi:hypothetical protein